MAVIDNAIVYQIENNHEDAEKKHAYMIMAHHRPDLLKLLVEFIDDRRNDIFIHIDRKASNIFVDNVIEVMHSNLYLLDSIEVNWGGYSQIECEYRLMKVSHDKGRYQYFHMMTGASFPLKSQDYIHDFFDKYQGTEFIGFDHTDNGDRCKLFYFKNEAGKLQGVRGMIIGHIRSIIIKIQKILQYDRLKKFGIVPMKGIAYFSVTAEFIQYILSMESDVYKLLRHSLCGDEVFVQTLAYNSDYIDKIYDFEDEFRGAVRGIAWDEVFGERPGHNFKMEDLEILLHNPWCFGLKFEGEDGIALLKEIRSHLQ